MYIDCISYKNTGRFSQLILDFLDEKPSVSHLYNHFPRIENFEKQLREKSVSYPSDHRKILVEQLEKQYQGLSISTQTAIHIEQLGLENTYTVTTGHQLNLFTGPLYFLYKIISTINLCKQLQQQYPTYNFVPIYWMATEDHDFEEINHFYFLEKKVVWNKPASGAVGRLSCEGLEEVYTHFATALGHSNTATYLKELFKKAYLSHETLTAATRYLANELFKKQGLVIIDADHAALKRCFIPYLKNEIEQQASFQVVSKTNEFLNKNYTAQVNPREINLFYLDQNLRERLVEKDGVYRVKNTPLEFTREQMLQLIEQQPEKFSPNVLMRPLYQEVILPNLCYIGGGGELAYWLQLKDYFDYQKIPFPILLLRNSALLIPRKLKQKAEKMQVEIQQLFLDKTTLQNQWIRAFSEIKIDFSPQRNHLQQQFAALNQLAEQTDPTFKNAVAAQEKKQLRGLATLEKRLLKAQKRKHSDLLARLENLHHQLFPGGNLQERVDNFSEWYREYGESWLTELGEQLDPLSLKFSLVYLD